jgi:hypothetical protein
MLDENLIRISSILENPRNRKLDEGTRGRRFSKDFLNGTTVLLEDGRKWGTWRGLERKD